MKLIYATNIWSHHQIPVATELAKILGCEQFRMAIFEHVHSERSQMGWGERSECAWVIGPPQTQHEKDDLFRDCINADVLIIGDCPRDILRARVAANKLTLIASERMIKKPWHRLRLLNPRYALGYARFRKAVNHPCVHALAIGHYAADDLRTLRAFGDRIWQWAYFVDVNPEPPTPRTAGLCRILWVGRMLQCKRVDTLLRAFAQLCQSHSDCHLTLVGDGPKKSSLQRLANRLNIPAGQIEFRPPVHFSEVRQLMREADIYVLPSNRQEGWGAVAGEAMSEGCVLVANEEAGAARELVSHERTGYLFPDDNVEQLSAILLKITNDYPLRMQIRQNAWNEIHALWSPQVAAERLIALSNGLLGNFDLPSFASGPCSKVISNSIYQAFEKQL